MAQFNRPGGWFGRAVLKAPPKAPRDRTFVEPNCEYCGDTLVIRNGFYEEPCPHCQQVCPKCANQGTYRIFQDGIPKDQWPVKYCECATGQAMQREVFDKRYAQSRLPKTFQDWTFDSFARLMAANPEAAAGKRLAFRAVKLWTQSLIAGKEGRVDYHQIDERVAPGDVRNWIVLYGPHGRGKTGLAASALNVLTANGLPCRYIRAMAMISAVQARFGDDADAIQYPNDGFGDMTAAQVKELLRTTPIQIADEFDMPDAKRENKQAIMEDWARVRTAEGLPTLVTTNLTYAELTERWGETTMSVIGASAHFILMDGLALRAQPREEAKG